MSTTPSVENADTSVTDSHPESSLAYNALVNRLQVQEKLIGFTSQSFDRLPEIDDFEGFESLTFRQRQLIMAKLREGEAAFNLKTLPAALAIFTGALVVVNVWAGTDGNSWALIVNCCVLAAVGITFLRFSRSQNRQEARLNAWVEGFKDSHALLIKKEEKRNEPAGDVVPTSPQAVAPHANN